MHAQGKAADEGKDSSGSDPDFSSGDESSEEEDADPDRRAKRRAWRSAWRAWRGAELSCIPTFLSCHTSPRDRSFA